MNNIQVAAVSGTKTQDALLKGKEIMKKLTKEKDQKTFGELLKSKLK